MLSENGKDWLHCSVLVAAIIVDCFVVSHVKLFYSSYLIIFVFLCCILNVGRDISQNRKNKNRLKEEPEKEKEDTSPVFQDDERRK
ncbi:hypothetical protein [Neglectibacter caecimuris]|uniref:hypothetical protein n=1 Tax=Neglectibacter caecimuris TaxID=3093658 RepID=UPI002AC916A6|nr:hypothetical protein [Neglectibacter sp. M00184]